jgi:hypothetical protein
MARPTLGDQYLAATSHIFDETRQVRLRLMDVYLGGLHSELSLV